MMSGGGAWPSCVSVMVELDHRQGVLAEGKVTERNRKEANRQSPAFIDAVGPSAEDCSKPQPCERTSRS